MTENSTIDTQTILEGRILDLQSLREVRGGKTSDASTAQAAFQRVAEKEELIDGLVAYMSRPDLLNRDYVRSAQEKIANLRTEIKAEYDDLIDKLELQEALRKLDLY